jgi:hypothetical protein
MVARKQSETGKGQDKISFKDMPSVSYYLY